MTDELVKILLRHVDGDDVNTETTWAKRVGVNLYELNNLPWYAYGVSCGDVVEAVQVDESFPELTRVVRKSGNRTLRVILDEAIPGDQNCSPLLDQLKSLGCSYEGMNRRYFAINIPAAVALVSVCDALTESGQQWEHADPTYTQLYPDGEAG